MCSENVLFSRPCHELRRQAKSLDRRRRQGLDLRAGNRGGGQHRLSRLFWFEYFAGGQPVAPPACPALTTFAFQFGATASQGGPASPKPCFAGLPATEAVMFIRANNRGNFMPEPAVGVSTPKPASPARATAATAPHQLRRAPGIAGPVHPHKRRQPTQGLWRQPAAPSGWRQPGR